MNLKCLSDDTLHVNLGNHIKNEMNEKSFILHHIVEVNRRDLHYKMGFPNLRAYLTESFGYDGGTAQRRIDAAKLSLAVPTLIESMEQGEISQAQVSFLQKSFRESKEKVTPEIKKKLVEQVKNKSVQETQVLVAKALDLKVLEGPKVTFQQNDTVNFSCPMEKETWEKMEQMRELLSTAVPSGNWQEILKYVAEKVIAAKLPKEPKVKVKDESVSVKTSNATSEYIDAKTRSQVIQRDKCCQYFSITKGKICGSKWNPQVDHIKPRWAGGDNSLENLRLLCANHNRAVYRSQSRIRSI